MKKLAYAVAFVIVVGLLAGGLLTKAKPPDGRALLISAAEAMEAADTIHARGRMYAAQKGTGEVSVSSSFEHWYGREGFRQQWYDPKGTLTWGLCGHVASGQVHRCMRRSGVVLTYDIGTEALATLLTDYRRDYLEGEVMARRNAKQFQVTPRPPHRETRDGREVTVIEVPIGSMVTQYDIDARSGRLLGLRSYVLSNSQKALQCETELEYGVALPAHLFSFRPPVGLKQQKGYFRMFEDGRIHFGVPGDGTDPSENVGKPTETQQEGGGGMGG